MSAGCILWLQRLQPLFASVAVAALSYQAWLVWRRAPSRRSPLVLAILGTSIATCTLAALTWIALWLRYR